MVNVTKCLQKYVYHLNLDILAEQVNYFRLSVIRKEHLGQRSRISISQLKFAEYARKAVQMVFA